MDHNQRFPVSHDLHEGHTNITVLKGFIAEFNKVTRWIKAVCDMSTQHRRHIGMTVMRLDTNLLPAGCECGDESSGSSAGEQVDQATIQYYDGSDFVDTTAPNRKSNLHNIHGVPFDRNDVVVTTYHRQSGKNLPIQPRYVRHARTVLDSDGGYPDEPSESSESSPESQIVYPFKFTRISFPEAAGSVAELDVTYLCPADEPDSYLVNMLPEWLPPGSDVAIYNVTRQWFSFAKPNDCQPESSSESSLSSSSVSSMSFGPCVCDGPAPSNIDLAISGLTGSSCCTSFNNGFAAVVALSGCDRWQLNNFYQPCSAGLVIDVFWELDPSDSSRARLVCTLQTLGGGGISITWASIYFDRPVDCCTVMQGLDLAFVSETGACGGTPTLTITHSGAGCE